MATGLIDIMKRAAMDANANSQPCDLRFGTVTGTSPLKVQITNQFTLPASLLIVPEHLTDHTVSVTVNWGTDSDTHYHSTDDGNTGNYTHDHSVSGKKSMTIHNALKAGDKVALLRKTGGQSYFILDRI